jgi:hypothetical protein
MKWDPHAAVALHAAQVLADPKSKDEDLVSARRAIASRTDESALDALPDEDLTRLEAEIMAAAVDDRCPRCGAERDPLSPIAAEEATRWVPPGGSGL